VNVGWEEDHGGGWVEEKEKVDEKDGRIWRVIQQRRQSLSSFFENVSFIRGLC
jgi:hypothetical protein